MLGKIEFKRPLLPCALLGCITVIFTFFNRWTVVFVAVGLIIAATLFLFLKSYKKTVTAVILVLIVFSVGNTLAEIDSALLLAGSEQTLTVTVKDEPQLTDSYAYVNVTVRQGAGLYSGTGLRMFYDPAEPIKTGDIINGSFKLTSFAEYENNLSFYSKGIYASANLLSHPERVGEDKITVLLFNVKEYIKDTLYSVMSFDAASTVTAIILGDKSTLSDELYSSVRVTGVSHVMAVSGLHLSIIMGLLLKLTDKFFYNKYIRFSVSLIFIIFIVSICGFTRSVLRAALMFALNIFAPIFGRRSDSLNSLCVAVLILLAVSPLVIFDIAFELSVLATFAVIVPAPYFTKAVMLRFKKPNALIEGIIGAVFTSLFAGLMTLPVTISEFGYVSGISILSNLLITYAVTGVLIFSVIGLALGYVDILSFVSKPFLLAAGYCAEYINQVILRLAQVPLAAVETESETLKSIAVFVSVLLNFVILAVMYTCKKRKHMIKLKRAILGKEE